MPPTTMPATAPVLRRAVAPLAGVEVRESVATGEDTHVFTGYAAVTDTTTTLYEGKRWVWRERIAPGAFTEVLADLRSGAATYPVVLNHEHDNRRAVASTAVPSHMPGGLELTEDGMGLRTFARLDATDPDVQALVPKIRARIVAQMSFAFRVAPQGLTTEVTEDEDGRTIETDTITRIASLYDVTVCAHGAYPTTSAELRGHLAAAGRSGIDPEDPDARTLVRALLTDGLAPDDPAVASATVTLAPEHPAVESNPRHVARLHAIRARLVVAQLTHNRKD